MAEITNDLIYEILKSIRQRLTNIENRVTDVNGQLVALRGHSSAIQSGVNSIYVTVAQPDIRVSHIECRLGVADNTIA